MSAEEAKTRAYSTAFAAFFRCMRRLVGEPGIAQLATSEPDEHHMFVATGDGRGFYVHVRITFEPMRLDGLTE